MALPLFPPLEVPCRSNTPPLHSVPSHHRRSHLVLPGGPGASTAPDPLPADRLVVGIFAVDCTEFSDFGPMAAMQMACRGRPADLSPHARLGQCNCCSIPSQRHLAIPAEIAPPVRMCLDSTGKFPDTCAFHFGSNLSNLRGTVPARAGRALPYQSNTISQKDRLMGSLMHYNYWDCRSGSKHDSPISG